VWNSPYDDHKEVVDQLSQFCIDNAQFQVIRNTNSTSKCDNLNFALSLVDTDMVLWNDADTIVSAETMCRASIHLFENGYDIAQSVNSHCKDDNTTCFGQSLCFVDGTQPMNMGVMGGHVPFNGHGGFWKTPMVKRVGFDHRVLCKDHDSSYRAQAYYGAKGIMDINMFCQEREPPTFKEMRSQRIRWETCAYQIHRVTPWVYHSPHFPGYEFVFLCLLHRLTSPMPLQEMALNVSTLLSTAVIRSAWTGSDHLMFWVFLGLICYSTLTKMVSDILVAVTSRYKPRSLNIAVAVLFFLQALTILLVWQYLRFFALLKIAVAVLFFVQALTNLAWQYLRFFALQDLFWGTGTWIPTLREAGLVKGSPKRLSETDQSETSSCSSTDRTMHPTERSMGSSFQDT